MAKKTKTNSKEIKIPALVAHLALNAAKLDPKEPESRFNRMIQYVRFEIAGGDLKVIATDGKQMAMITLDAIAPTKLKVAWNVLGTDLTKAYRELPGKKATMREGDQRHFTLVIDGKNLSMNEMDIATDHFPEYQSIIDSALKNDKEIKTDRHFVHVAPVYWSMPLKTFERIDRDIMGKDSKPTPFEMRVCGATKPIILQSDIFSSPYDIFKGNEYVKFFALVMPVSK